jgi:hypothetical protein
VGATCCDEWSAEASARPIAAEDGGLAGLVVPPALAGHAPLLGPGRGVGVAVVRARQRPGGLDGDVAGPRRWPSVSTFVAGCLVGSCASRGGDHQRGADDGEDADEAASQDVGATDRGSPIIGAVQRSRLGAAARGQVQTSSTP